jgi:small subunit ribosomal protein S3
MGHKTHPYGFRLGIIKDWKANWFAPNSSSYRSLVIEDLNLRNSIRDQYKAFSDAGIAKVEIDRGAQDSVINIHSARPGILIGRDGERVKILRTKLEEITKSRVQLNILEIEQPEINAYLVARNVADQMERRVAYRRAMRQAAQRAMQAGAQGIKIIVKGRISGSEIARVEKLMMGQGRHRLFLGRGPHGYGSGRSQGLGVQRRDPAASTRRGRRTGNDRGYGSSR